MSTHNPDELPELVNSFRGEEGIQIGAFWRRWKPSADKTEKLHRVNAWDEVKAIANSSYKVTDIWINRGNEVRKTHHPLETTLIKVPSSLQITSSNNISVFILFIEFGYFCVFLWKFLFPQCFIPFPFLFLSLFLLCFVFKDLIFFLVSHCMEMIWVKFSLRVNPILLIS